MNRKFTVATSILASAMLAACAVAAQPPTPNGQQLPPGIVLAIGQERLRSGDPTHLACFTPDSSAILTAHTSGALRFWDAHTGLLLATSMPPSAASPTALVITPDGSTAITAYGTTLRFWSVPARRFVRELDLRNKDTISAMALSRDGKFLATGGKQIWLWDAATGRPIGAIPGGKDPIRALAFSPDAKRLAVSTGAQVAVIDLSSGRIAASPPPEKDTILHLAWSASGKYLATAGSHLHLYNAQCRPATLPGGDTSTLPCMAMSFAPRGDLLAGIMLSKGLVFWDLDAGEEKEPAPCTPKLPPQMAWSKDAKMLAFAGGTEIELWDVENRQRVLDNAPAEKMPHQRLYGLAVSADGKRIASIGGNVCLWDAQTGRRVTTQPSSAAPTPFDSDQQYCRWASFSPDGKWLLIRAYETASLWDARTLEPGPKLAIGAQAPHAISADFKLLAEAAADKTTTIWDIATGRMTGRIVTDKPVESLAFLADGKVLATLSSGSLSLWDIASGQGIYRVNTGDQRACSLHATPDGRFLVGGGATTHLWDARAGAQVWSAPIPSTGVCISPDGRFILARSAGKVAVLELLTGTPIATLAGHDGDVVDAAFFPQSGRVVTCGADLRILVWDWSRLLLSAAKLDPRKPFPADLVWRNLNLPDAAAAYLAAWMLIDHPDEAIRLLTKNLKPGAEPLRISRCIFILEQIGSAPAVQLLESLQKDDRFTAQIQTALDRIRAQRTK